MTDTATTTGRAHPIGRAVSRFSDELKTLRDQPVWSMDVAETRDTMVEITFAEAQLAELKARVTAHGQTIEVEADSGATSTANWLAHQTRQTRAGAHRATKFAIALGSKAHDPVRIALADGELLVDQAEVIIAAIDALPDDLDPEIVRRRPVPVDRLRRRARREGAADPGQADPRRGRPRGRRSPRSEGAGARGARRGGGGEVPDVRGRSRQVARKVHPAHAAGRDAEEDPDGHRRPEAPGRGRRLRAGP